MKRVKTQGLLVPPGPPWLMSNECDKFSIQRISKNSNSSYVLFVPSAFSGPIVGSLTHWWLADGMVNGFVVRRVLLSNEIPPEKWKTENENV